MTHGKVGQDMLWERLSDASQGYSEDLEEFEEAVPTDDDMVETMRLAPGEDVDDAADAEVRKSLNRQEKPEDLATWTKHTQSQLSLAESLRRDASQVLCEPLEQPKMSAKGNLGLSNRNVQEQVKKNIAKREKLQRVLHSRIETCRLCIEKVSHNVVHLLEAFNEKEAPLEVAERRLDLRAKRPPREMIQDHLQEALERERMVLSRARERLVKHVETGHDLLKSLEHVKAQTVSEMQHKHQLLKLDRSALLFDGFHSDEGKLPRKARAQRSGLVERDIAGIHQLLDSLRERQELASRFCKESDTLLLQTRRDCEQASAKTKVSLRKRISETSELKRQLEKELAETCGTMASAEQTLGIMNKQLSSKGKWHRSQTNSLLLPDEVAVNLEPHQHINNNEELYEKLVTLEKLTGRLFERAAAVVGEGTSLPGWRQAEAMLDVQSNTLNEGIVELEAALCSARGEALRKFNQVAEKLYAQRDHLAHELQHIESVKQDLTQVLKERCEKVEYTLQGMKSAKEQLADDLQSKTEALKLDVACLKVAVAVPAKKPEDETLFRSAREIFQLPSPKPFRPPLHSETLETVKQRVRASAYTGGGDSGSELDVIFRRFDKDGSGQLDDREVRMALRRTLRVPPSMISDAQISSLCAMLDADKSGSVSIDELVEFIGTGPAMSPRTGRPLKGPGVLLSPINTVELSDHENHHHQVKADKVRLPRSYRAPLQKADLDVLRSKIKAASYTGSGLGRQISDVFLRFDKDGSGQLEDHEVRMALRRTLRIPPSAISDAQISSLCALLDKDHSGAVSIMELVDFVGPEPEVSHRTGRRLQLSFANVQEWSPEDIEAAPSKPPGGAKLEPILPLSSTAGGCTEADKSELR